MRARWIWPTLAGLFFVAAVASATGGYLLADRRTDALLTAEAQFATASTEVESLRKQLADELRASRTTAVRLIDLRNQLAQRQRELDDLRRLQDASESEPPPEPIVEYVPFYVPVPVLPVSTDSPSDSAGALSTCPYASAEQYLTVLSRLDVGEGTALAQLAGEMAERGIVGSGPHQTLEGQIREQFNRAREDLAFACPQFA